jgi:hypothetical protein
MLICSVLSSSVSLAGNAAERALLERRLAEARAEVSM